jgi:hypothetical protein
MPKIGKAGVHSDIALDSEVTAALASKADTSALTSKADTTTVTALQFYDVGGGFGIKPSANEVILVYRTARALSFAANFTGSVGYANVAPTASTTFTVHTKTTPTGSETQIGTIVFGTNKSATFTTTSGTAKSMAVGDILIVKAPASPDATLAEGCFTLIATLV